MSTNARVSRSTMRRANVPARLRLGAVGPTASHDDTPRRVDKKKWETRRTVSLLLDSGRSVIGTVKRHFLLLLGSSVCMCFGVWLLCTFYNKNASFLPEFMLAAQPAKRTPKGLKTQQVLLSSAVIPDSVRNPRVKKKTAQWQVEDKRVELPLPMSPRCVEQQSQVDEFCNLNYQGNCPLHTPEPIPPAEEQKLKKASTTSQCKTLWLAGFGEGPEARCSDAKSGGDDKGGTGVRVQYAAALQSARYHAKDVLQPVFLLGQYERSDEDVSKIAAFAESHGAIVVTVNQLSFQDHIAAWHRDLNIVSIDHQMGPYMRLDIPGIIEQHKLFDLPGICPHHVLYTDADCLFVNPVEHADMDALKAYMVHRKSPPTESWWKAFWSRFWLGGAPPFVMYGRESKLNTMQPSNTGVMLIDVARFQKELPAIIQFRNEYPDQTVFTSFDQVWLNLYFEQNRRLGSGRHMLPLYWNWKLYWRLEPSCFSDLKIVHFHGPKPERGAWKMAHCQLNLTDFWPPEYHAFIHNAICCDRGKTATHVHDFYHIVAPSHQDVC